MPSCFAFADPRPLCRRSASWAYSADFLRPRPVENELKAASKGACRRCRRAVPDGPSVARGQGGPEARWGTARDRGVEGPTRGAGGVRGRAGRPPGGPLDACAGVGATARIRVTDSAKGGPELIIMYMYARPCMRWGVQYYLWGSGACGTALFAPKYALLRRTAGKSGLGREKLTFTDLKWVFVLNKD